MSDVLENLIKAAGTKNSDNVRTDNLAMDHDKFFKNAKEAKEFKYSKFDSGGLPESARLIESSDKKEETMKKENEENEDELDPKGQKRARFLPNSSVTLMYGPPGSGKSYLLRKMYQEPPLDDSGNQAIQGVVVFTSTPTDWADIHKGCIS